MGRFWVVTYKLCGLTLFWAAILPNEIVTWASQSIMAKTPEIQITEVSKVRNKKKTMSRGESFSRIITKQFSFCVRKPKCLDKCSNNVSTILRCFAANLRIKCLSAFLGHTVSGFGLQKSLPWDCSCSPRVIRYPRYPW